MGNESALGEVDAVGGVITDHHPLDLHTLGLAGCIDRLTGPLRQQGTTVRWDTPHWGIEIPADCAYLRYQTAREAMRNAVKYAGAGELNVQTAAGGHGIRRVVEGDGRGWEGERGVRGKKQG